MTIKLHHKNTFKIETDGISWKNSQSRGYNKIYRVTWGCGGVGNNHMLSQNVPKYHHYVNKMQIWTIGHHKIVTQLIWDREQYHLLKIERISEGCDHIVGRLGWPNTKFLTKNEQKYQGYSNKLKIWTFCQYNFTTKLI